MTAPNLIRSLDEIADRYDAILCDVWGVVHNGVAAYPAARAALARFQAARGPVALISNAPRPSDAVRPQLDQMGVGEEAYAEFVTSGDATRAELLRRAPGPCWAIGPVRDAALFEGLPLELVETPEESAFVCATGLFDDETETPADYEGRLRTCAERRLEMVCANPDRVVQRGERMIYCAGALADLYAELGGRVTMVGKPYAPIYVLALERVSRRLGRTVEPARVLAIGDGAPTDVLGANAQGLDCLFIAAGIHAEAVLGADGAVDPARAEAFLTREGAHAAYVMAGLA